MELTIGSATEMQQLGAKLGGLLRGGEVVELVGDVGAGKTTLVKGLAAGLGVDEDVQSPTFTISRVYQAGGERMLAHYDFYRLSEPGVMRAELDESVRDTHTITVIEWAQVVADVLPPDTLCITIALSAQGEDVRQVAIAGGGERSLAIMEQLA